MVEFDRTLEREAPPTENLKICVVGIGGGGLNVLDRISLDRMLDATVVAMHTDVRVLTHSMSAAKIQLGAEIMRGIGSGGDPELGREAAVASKDKIRAVVSGHNIVFICCGLGGGTGSGAAPIVARLAKESGALVFVFATTPFVFEGRRRLQQAEAAMEELQKNTDALILFENNRMGELVLPKEGIQKAFSQADQLIGHSLRAIATMVTQPGIVRMGLADLMTALSSPNARCLFGFGEARGANRVADALKRSLKSPLVNQGQLLQNARNLLVHVAGGESLTLAEVESLMKQLSKCVPDSTQIMFGLAVDPRMGDAISVTLVSSLSAHEMSPESVQVQQGAKAEPDVESEIEPEAEVEAKVELAPVVAEAPVASAPVVEAPAEVSVAAAPVPTPIPVSAPVVQAQAPVEDVRIEAPKQPEPAPAATAVVQAAAAVAPKVEAATPPVMVERDLFGAEVPGTSHFAAAPSATTAVAPVQAPVQPLTQSAIEVKASAVSHANGNSNGNAAHQAQVRIVIPKQPSQVEEAEAPVEKAAAHQPNSIFSQDAEESEEYEAFEEVAASTPASAPVSQAAAAPKSIFSVIDNGDDDEDEDQMTNEVDDEPGTHWADKYSQGAPKQSAPLESRGPAMAKASANTGAAPAPVGAGVGAGFKQGNFNLNQDEAGRFKGTPKTIVEGEDLDIPTWMRLKKK